MELTKLNKEQKEAVLLTEGPLLILAGAGTGKTRVLTTKVAYLIEECGINPYNILAITFTNKAAKEMKERIYSMVGEKARNAQVSTFHSFGVRILSEYYDKLGYQKNFIIMDSDDSLSLIKKIIKEKDLDIKIYNPNSIRNKISSCKNEMIPSNEYNKYANNDYEKVFLSIYEEYEKKLKDNNAIDFDDLLLLPIKLFKENKEVLEHYQNRFQYVLIDEYQDTNEAQYILTKMISAKNRNICCVGDIDQSIYSFRGANYRNILNFENDYKDAKTIKLEQNYRSTNIILKAANDVIKHNKERKEKNLWTDKGEGDKITYYRSYTGIGEAKFVANEINNLIDQGIEYGNIAVLYRTNAQSRTLEDTLLKEKVPYKILGGVGFYSRKEIKDILAYLRLIYNSKDDMSLIRVINVPKRGIGNKTLEKLNEKSIIENKSIYESIEQGKELEFKKLIEHFKEVSKSKTLTELLEIVIEETNIKSEYEEKNIENEMRLENIEELKTITRAFEEKDGLVSLEDFLVEVGLFADPEERNDDPNKVSLMTVHSVKGLEFDYVFIVGMEEEIFPHINSLLIENDIEEERRLCYVAITRAKEKLYIVNAQSRILFGQDKINPPSRFISEISDDLLLKKGDVEKKENKVEEKINIKENYYENDGIEINVGDNVYHNVFGNGKVVSINGNIAQIAFKHPYGIKSLMKNHKSITKI